jgi:hypothetical protein
VVLGFELRASYSISRYSTRRQGVVNYLPGLASNDDPPDLSLPSSWDYRCEPLVPSKLYIFKLLTWAGRVAQVEECLPSMCEVWHILWSLAPQKQKHKPKVVNLPGMVGNACHPNIWEVGVGRLWLRRQPRLHNKTLLFTIPRNVTGCCLFVCECLCKILLYKHLVPLKLVNLQKKKKNPATTGLTFMCLFFCQHCGLNSGPHPC